MEIQNLSFIYLMSIKRHQLFINQLNLRFFIINSFGSIFLFFGSILLYRFFFTFNLLEIYSILESLQFEILEISQLYILFCLCFLIIGLFLKIGIGPFGLWIVDLYEYSPLIMIIIFSLIPKFGYLIFLYNIYLSTFSFFYFWKIIFLYLGLLSIIIGSLGALNQIKFKKLLAFSTLNYLGYIFLTFSNFNVYSSFLSMLYFLLYIFVNIFIWYIVMVLEIKLRRNIFIVDLSYLKYENNFIKLGFIFSMLYLSGLPPFYLFSLKFLTFNILKTSYLISFIFLVCNIISIFYYIRLIKILYIYNVRDIHYKYLINVIILLYVYFFFIIISYPYLFIDFNLDDCLDSCKSVKFSFLYK
jgi:NADH:ubiquinone oxidoreductase subunit 2 (subunit N)